MATMTLKGVNPDGVTKLEGAGVALESDTTEDIQLVSEGDLRKLAADEAFLNEIVTIRISQSINPNDTPYANITCNNEAGRVIIPRGIPFRVKRMHVEILARMKELHYRQQEVYGGDLEKGNALYQRVGVVYPFDVVKDDNPKGRAWLDNILAEPV